MDLLFKKGRARDQRGVSKEGEGLIVTNQIRKIRKRKKSLRERIP